MGSKSAVLRENPASGASFVVWQNVGSGLTQAVILCDSDGDPVGISGDELHVAGSVLSAIQAAVETIDNAISGSEMQVDIVAGPTGTSSLRTQGTAADGASAVGNPLQIGGKTSGDVMQTVLVDNDGRVLSDANLQVSNGDVSESNPVPTAVAMSSQGTFTIPSGQNGSAETPVDLGANYKAILIRCENCQYIPASTTMRLQAGEGASDTMCNVYPADDPSSQWVSGDLPTSGTLRLVSTNAFGARRIRVILSNNSTGGSTVFYIYGIEKLI